VSKRTANTAAEALGAERNDGVMGVESPKRWVLAQIQQATTPVSVSSISERYFRI
ncbi:hypothetical protein SARC_17612, partial [Sphaeroforma arctica JP610]